MSIVQTREQAPRIAPVRASAPRVSAAGGGGLTFKDVSKVVRRRKWLIVISLLACTAITVVATFLWQRYLPIYTVEADIRVVPPTKSVLVFAPDVYNKDLLDRYKQTQAGLIKSALVLTDALQTPEVKKTQWFRKYGSADLKKAQQQLKDDLQVSLMPNTEYISISMSAATSQEVEKEQLASIVNAVAKSFETEVNRIVTDTWEQSQSTLNKQASKLEDLLRARHEQINRLVLSSPAESMRSQNNGLTTELQRLSEQITQIQVLQNQAQNAMAALQKQKEEGLLGTNPQVLQALDMDPTLRGLMAEEINIVAALANYQRQFGAEHPQVKSAEVRLQAIREKSKERKKELIDAQVASMEDERAAQLTSLTSQLVDVTERRDRAMAARKDIDQKLETISNLEVEIKDLEDQLRTINAKRNDIELVTKDEDTLPAKIRHEAEVPLQPSWPKWSVMIPLGIILGLIVGFGLSFLLEFIDTSVKTPTDILRRVDLPLLAMVPHADDMAEDIEDLRLACKDVMHSPINEAYRELRTNLLFSGPARERRSLLITSASPDDGRTCVSTNLAIAMANNSQRVLLIDSNFRRPAIREVFPEAGEAGLSNVLSGQIPWQDCVRTTTVPNLSVLSSGPLPPNPNELLGRELTKTVLNEMIEAYDQVIIDGPPLLLFTDATVLATRVDGVLLIVRAGVNTHGIAQRCRHSLDRVGAHTLGVVLNGVRTTIGGYLEKNYQTFYDYHSNGKEEGNGKSGNGKAV